MQIRPRGKGQWENKNKDTQAIVSPRISVVELRSGPRGLWGGTMERDVQVVTWSPFPGAEKQPVLLSGMI